MIKSIRYENFKILRDATLPLGQFTLLIGANGSGKSAAMQVLKIIHSHSWLSSPPQDTFSAELRAIDLSKEKMQFSLTWLDDGAEVILRCTYHIHSGFTTEFLNYQGHDTEQILRQLGSLRIFQFDPGLIAQPCRLEPYQELNEDGANLAVVLDGLRDSHPERFEALNQELGRWLPEFDRILFETPGTGMRAFLLRTSMGKHPIRATHLSQGTLLALAFLTIAHLPHPPAIVCFEEPERGIHPRLLREVQDAMYRLAYPQNYGENRAPVQVIAITHSPYLLDLYRDHPEEIVVAEKTANGAVFKALADMEHLEDVLQGAPLGEAWYTGIFGGVPTTP